MLSGVARDAGADPPREAGILGLLQHGSGRVALYGDSNCLDSSHQRTSCFDFLKPLLAWTAGVSGTASRLPDLQTAILAIAVAGRAAKLFGHK